MIVLWFLCGLPLVLGEKNCCLIKRVLSGPLEGVYDLKGERQEKEDCMDDCVYTRDVDGEDYCFSSVPNFPVECTDKDGKFVKCTNPNPPYPNNSPCKLPDGRTKNGTCCGIVSHKKMISAKGICYPPGTQCVDNATNYGACNQIMCKNDHDCKVNNCGQCVKGRCTDKMTGNCTNLGGSPCQVDGKLKSGFCCPKDTLFPGVCVHTPSDCYHDAANSSGPGTGPAPAPTQCSTRLPDEQITLVCGTVVSPNKKIEIVNVVYADLSDMSQCDLPTAKNAVTGICEGQSSCTVIAINDIGKIPNCNSKNIVLQICYKCT